MIHYHGCPITPNEVMRSLAGKFFCHSFADPRQTALGHEIGQGNMLDNGAFTAWRQGRHPDWDKWAEWVQPWLEHKTTWAVIPDVIDGGPEDNDALIRRYATTVGKQGAPVWHLDEPLSRLLELAENWERICFGSAGEYARVRSPAWHERVSEAFDALADSHGRIPVWIHMLRGMALSGGPYPFASVDSTDVARNHHRPQNTATGMAARWDARQTPARWEPQLVGGA